MQTLSIAFLPPLIAIAGLLFWKFTYVGRRPLSPGVKLIVAALVIWSFLPMLAMIVLNLLLYAIAASGGRLGD